MTLKLYNNIAKFVFCLCVIIVATEPECSKYSYEEQLLSKMIRVEFKLEQIDEKTLKLRENVQDTLTAIQEERIKINSQLSDVKDEMKREIEKQVLKVNATLQYFLSEKTKPLDEPRNWNNATTVPIGGVSLPQDCLGVLQAGSKASGVYSVAEFGSHEKFDVYCDMNTDGGGWTVFHNRFDGSVDFYRNFSQYENGFGLLTGEFWLGLRKIYYMTNGHENTLRIDLMDANGVATYEKFRNFLLSPSPRYNLHLGAFESTTLRGTSQLSYHDRMPFTTFDNDQDESKTRNCAEQYHGAWWYKECYYVNLNGLYLKPGTDLYTGMIYRPYGENHSLKRAKMMFRRQ